MNESKKYGIIAGVATVGYMLLFYMIDRPLMLNMKIYWSSFLIYFFCMYKACVDCRSKNENEVLDLKEGFVIAFRTFLIANGIFYIFYYILLNFVDPDLINLQMEIAQQMYKDYMPAEQAAEMTKNMNKEGFEMTINKAVSEYAKGAIVGAVFSLFIAASVRQD